MADVVMAALGAGGDGSAPGGAERSLSSKTVIQFATAGTADSEFTRG